MKWIGLNNREYNVNLATYRLKPGDILPSKLAEKSLSVIKEVYPSDEICAEIYLEGAPFKLYLDFYLPLRRIGIEVQGEQHFSANAHFSGTRGDKQSTNLSFRRAQKRDTIKKELLELNNITLVYFNYNQTYEEWYDSLVGAY